MTLSGPTKILIALATLVGIFLFLVIVDFGVNAGQIHHGVYVRDIDVGGLTKDEAAALLEDEGEKLSSSPVILTREGMSCNFEPPELGWDPRPNDTAVAAYRIGRGVEWATAIGNRVKAWVAGATVDWSDELDTHAVSELIDYCERQAEGLGYELRRYRLREKIREAIKTWPRQPVTIPIAQER